MATVTVSTETRYGTTYQTSLHHAYDLVKKSRRDREPEPSAWWRDWTRGAVDDAWAELAPLRVHLLDRTDYSSCGTTVLVYSPEDYAVALHVPRDPIYTGIRLVLVMERGGTYAFKLDPVCESDLDVPVYEWLVNTLPCGDFVGCLQTAFIDAPGTRATLAARQWMEETGRHRTLYEHDEDEVEAKYAALYRAVATRVAHDYGDDVTVDVLSAYNITYDRLRQQHTEHVTARETNQLMAELERAKNASLDALFDRLMLAVAEGTVLDPQNEIGSLRAARRLYQDFAQHLETAALSPVAASHNELEQRVCLSTYQRYTAYMNAFHQSAGTVHPGVAMLRTEVDNEMRTTSLLYALFDAYAQLAQRPIDSWDFYQYDTSAIRALNANMGKRVDEWNKSKLEMLSKKAAEMLQFYDEFVSPATDHVYVTWTPHTFATFYKNHIDYYRGKAARHGELQVDNAGVGERWRDSARRCVNWLSRETVSAIYRQKTVEVPVRCGRTLTECRDAVQTLLGSVEERETIGVLCERLVGDYMKTVDYWSFARNLHGIRDRQTDVLGRVFDLVTVLGKCSGFAGGAATAREPVLYMDIVAGDDDVPAAGQLVLGSETDLHEFVAETKDNAVNTYDVRLLGVAYPLGAAGDRTVTVGDLIDRLVAPTWQKQVLDAQHKHERAIADALAAYTARVEECLDVARDQRSTVNDVYDKVTQRLLQPRLIDPGDDENRHERVRHASFWAAVDGVCRQNGDLLSDIRTLIPHQYRTAFVQDYLGLWRVDLRAYEQGETRGWVNRAGMAILSGVCDAESAQGQVIDVATTCMARLAAHQKRQWRDFTHSYAGTNRFYQTRTLKVSTRQGHPLMADAFVSNDHLAGYCMPALKTALTKVLESGDSVEHMRDTTVEMAITQALRWLRGDADAEWMAVAHKTTVGGRVAVAAAQQDELQQQQHHSNFRAFRPGMQRLDERGAVTALLAWFFVDALLPSWQLVLAGPESEPWSDDEKQSAVTAVLTALCENVSVYSRVEQGAQPSAAVPGIAAITVGDRRVDIYRRLEMNTGVLYEEAMPVGPRRDDNRITVAADAGGGAVLMGTTPIQRPSNLQRTRLMRSLAARLKRVDKAKMTALAAALVAANLEQQEQDENEPVPMETLTAHEIDEQLGGGVGGKPRISAELVEALMTGEFWLRDRPLFTWLRSMGANLVDKAQRVMFDVTADAPELRYSRRPPIGVGGELTFTDFVNSMDNLRELFASRLPLTGELLGMETTWYDEMRNDQHDVADWLHRNALPDIRVEPQPQQHLPGQLPPNIYGVPNRVDISRGWPDLVFRGGDGFIEVDDQYEFDEDFHMPVDAAGEPGVEEDMLARILARSRLADEEEGKSSTNEDEDAASSTSTSSSDSDRPESPSPDDDDDDDDNLPVLARRGFIIKSSASYPLRHLLALTHYRRRVLAARDD